MGFACEGEVYIPFEDWYQFVQKYLPSQDAEAAIGPPQYNEGEGLSVPFALNTECHPAEQSVKPAFMVRPK